MLLNNYFNFQLTPRLEGTKPYHLQLNESALRILSLVFEFKMATPCHISRFVRHQDHNKYIYLRLRRMWQLGLLESFKVGTGFVYYFLSKRGLNILEDQGLYDPSQLSKYPKGSTLLSHSFFPHESQIVELASMEIMNVNKEKGLSINFLGEAVSQGQDYKSDKTIEAFTPDYTVYYKFGEEKHCIYTEFERTPKSKAAMYRKLDRYLYHLSYEQRKDIILRIIFQTPAMEKSFWKEMFLNSYQTLQSLKVLTTNLTLIKDHKDFFKAIYVSEQTLQLTKPNHVEVDISRKRKLFEWM